MFDDCVVLWVEVMNSSRKLPPALMADGFSAQSLGDGVGAVGVDRLRGGLGCQTHPQRQTKQHGGKPAAQGRKG